MKHTKFAHYLLNILSKLKLKFVELFVVFIEEREVFKVTPIMITFSNYHDSLS